MTFQAVKCPDCGFLFTPTPDGLVPVHGSPGPLPWQVGCPGTGKKPAEAAADEEPADYLTCPVAGHTMPVLMFEPGWHSCQNIMKGVSFTHGTAVEPWADGCWVIRFEDLERFYLAAKAARERKPQEQAPDS